jgi:hypothetical protein
MHHTKSPITSNSVFSGSWFQSCFTSKSYKVCQTYSIRNFFACFCGELYYTFLRIGIGVIHFSDVKAEVPPQVLLLMRSEGWGQTPLLMCMAHFYHTYFSLFGFYGCRSRFDLHFEIKYYKIRIGSLLWVYVPFFQNA